MVDFKTHDLLSHPSLSHGFFGRQGGVSKGSYQSLNTGRGSDDLPENVAENRKHVAQQIGTNRLARTRKTCLASGNITAQMF